jgi:Tfp pilus assembly protein PilF
MTYIRSIIAAAAVALSMFLPSSAGFAQQSDSAGDWQALAARAKQCFAAGDLAESEQNWRDAVALAEQTTNIEPGVVNCLIGLAYVNDKRGNPQEAERLYELAMRTMESLVGPTSPRFADYMPDLAFLYDAHGKPQKAELLFKKALLLKQNAYGADDARVAEVLELYAKFLRKNERLVEANELETRARNIRAKLAG